MGRAIGWAYAVIALLTFAWSASDPANVCTPFEQQQEQCWTTGAQVTKGLFAAALWPVYWTWSGVDLARKRGWL